MDDCCTAKGDELSSLKHDHKKVLLFVLIINASLFGIELGAGFLANSTALIADSLDMLGDAFAYGFSLYVLWRSAEWKAKAALLKAVVMAVFGMGVLLEAIHKLMAGILPTAEIMGLIGTLVLLGNAVCFFLLYQYRSDDLNMRSTWLCSRNDIVANVAVLLAALFVRVFEASWPDIMVGAGIAALFLQSALSVLRESISELQAIKSQPSLG
jgi:cation diffusion facilitator family transporter